MDSVAAIRYLGPLVVHTAAKDVCINEDHAAVHGALDGRFRRLSPEEDRVNLGGDERVSEWPADSAWDFVALGRGQDFNFWTRFVEALREVAADVLVRAATPATS
ncbi:MAG: hypothetical protein ABIQ59_16120 [Nocardioidaceae bacterium]